MSRSPSRSPAIQDAWTSCVTLCARAWQRPQCATRVPSRAKWKLRFAPCGSIGVQPRLGMSKYQLDRIKGEWLNIPRPKFQPSPSGAGRGDDGATTWRAIASGVPRLETLGEVVGVEEYLHVLAKPVVAVVVVAPNSRLFESTVHPLD